MGVAVKQQFHAQCAAGKQLALPLREAGYELPSLKENRYEPRFSTII
jgi:hypothetical protein